ncbi:hypothetical protein AB4259_21210 [Vibrio amylolyticus]|uniref:hypothetical protein n=1 Tax=Vibrio TaxID=662 RepID=UPI000C85BCBD|nr:hypothetical protein [Vibrio sp. 10N.261.55.A7]PMJ90429.1 hypothetical protein BCU12_12100 [Vibrio sp. 10N.261.55.A7]
MQEQQLLYSQFYKAQDRFLEQKAPSGFEPDIIQDYIHWGISLASHHEANANNENLLLCELYLRQIFFHLIDAIESPHRSLTFRQVCLNSIYSPLFNLKRHYYQQVGGRPRFSALQQKLQHVQAPFG